MIRTLEQAARWVDEVNGSPEPNWAVRRPDGTFVRWTDEMGFLWSAKDELPARGLVCVGKHVARVAACVAPGFLPVLVAANAEEPAEDEAPVVEAVHDLGPLTPPELREATGLAKKDADKAVASLHRKLVLTNARLEEAGSGWGSIAHDLLARKWRVRRRLPAREDARRELAGRVLDLAGEATAADVAGLFGWRRKETAALLDEVADGRDDPAGFRIWTRR